MRTYKGMKETKKHLPSRITSSNNNSVFVSGTSGCSDTRMLSRKVDGGYEA